MAKILIVEDDADLCSRICDWLAHEYHTVDFVHEGDVGLERLKFYHFDLVILDWELPKLTGIEVCQRFRASGGQTPVLMLTGKGEIASKTKGLDAGADDYLTKPFDMRELSARVRALCRRRGTVEENVLEVQDLKLDTLSKILHKGEQTIALTPKEYALIELFMKHPDEVFSQELLLERIWSSESTATVYSVYTAVKGLRKKLAAAGGEESPLRTVYGLGYRLESK